jgi:hypothetical protein
MAEKAQISQKSRGLRSNRSFFTHTIPFCGNPGFLAYLGAFRASQRWMISGWIS